MGFQHLVTEGGLATKTAVGAVVLCPAIVLETAGSRLTVQPAKGAAGPVEAVLAMTLGYAAAAGDSVLVVGQDDDWYVLGVIHGHGATTLVAPGDVEIAAPAGEIRLSAANGVRVAGGLFDVCCRAVSVTAASVLERFQVATRRVSGCQDQHVGENRLRVDGVHTLSAEHIVASARKHAKIDGEAVSLG